MPFVVPFVYERIALLFIQLGDHLEAVWVTRNERSPAKERGVLRHPVRLSKSSGIGDNLLW